MYRGVWRTSWGNRWQAGIYRAGERYHLGTHEDAESAARAYDTAAIALLGPRARLNFPPSGDEHLVEDEAGEHGHADPPGHH